jgi:FdhD protein
MVAPKLVRHDTKKIVRSTPPQQAHEELAVEMPLEIRVNHEPFASCMRTPGDDFDLAAGFLFTEGVVHVSKDISAMRYVTPDNHKDDRGVVDVTLGEHVKTDLSKLRRGPVGLKTSTDHGRKAVKPVTARFKLKLDIFYTLGTALRRAHAVFEQTGGLHAAGVFDLRGTLLGLREDIGRHNAVDKILGSMFVNDQTPLDHHILMLSGRATYEIMHKALAARIPVVAAVQAPSSAAVEFAQSAGQTLVGYLRADAFNVYAHADRIEV